MKVKAKKLTSTVSSKGPVTIPKQVRDPLGLSAGSRVEFEVIDDTLWVKKSAVGNPAFLEWAGYIQRNKIDFPYKDSLEAVDDMRGRGTWRPLSTRISSFTFCLTIPFSRLGRCEPSPKRRAADG